MEEKQILKVNGKALEKIAAVDFDGTISKYLRWEGPTRTGPILYGVRRALYRLKEAGYVIVIFSARAVTLEGESAIRDWLAAHRLDEIVSDVVSVKPPFTVSFDDRAWHVQSNKNNGLLDAVLRYLKTKEYDVP